MKTRSVVSLNGVRNDCNAGFAGINGKYKKISKCTWDSSLPFPRVPSSLSVIIVGTAAVVCYVNSLDGGFVFDDSEAIVNNEDLKPETPISNLLYNDFWGTRLTHNASHKSYRPLTVLSFRWNYWLAGGLQPRGYHLTNIALHAVVSMLSLAVFNLLLGGACQKASLLAALLFAVHPIHTEAVAGVVGRADLLCALFYFLSFIAYCSSLRISWGINQLATLLLSMFLCATAMFCKEQGITVIGLCSVYDVIVNSKLHPIIILRLIWRHLRPHRKKPSLKNSGDSSVPTSSNCENEDFQLKPLLLRHMVLLMSGLTLLFVRWKVMASAAPTFQRVDNPASFADSLFTRVFSYNYIYALNGWLLLCPEWLCFDWSMGCIPLVESVEPRLLAIGVFWMILGLLIWRSLNLGNGREQRCLTMCLAATVIPFLPASNLFFRVGFVVAERVLYLPSVGFCLLLVVGLCQVAKVQKIRRVTAWRSAEWQSEAVLFKSGLSVCPLNAKVHYNIAKNAGDAGNRTLAVFEYREALRLHSEYDQAMNNLANILKDEGKLIEAESLLRKAVDLRPDFAAAWMNLGIVLAGLKRHSEAEASYFTALIHRKKYPDCYYNLGNLRYNDAYRAWRNATALKPTHTVAWSNMIIMLDSIGEMEKAESVAQEALTILPLEPSLHFNLANTLGKAGRFAEAEKHFTEAIGLDLKNAVYYTNLGVLYHRWKKYDKAERLYRRALELNPQLQSAKDNMVLLQKARNRIGNRH
ncbi:Transmembrane and TPR repeat-containing protein 4 [Blattella germanica]|nr:Transmembrane and TPR repeat-containing protein 4 [Blattella germanica]